MSDPSASTTAWVWMTIYWLCVFRVRRAATARRESPNKGLVNGGLPQAAASPQADNDLILQEDAD